MTKLVEFLKMDMHNFFDRKKGAIFFNYQIENFNRVGSFTTVLVKVLRLDNRYENLVAIFVSE